MLQLPHGKPRFDLINSCRDRGKALGAVRGGDDGDERPVPDAELPDAVHEREPVHVEAFGHIACHVPHELRGCGVRRILDVGDLPAPVMVADDSLEYREGAGPGIVDRASQGGNVDGVGLHGGGADAGERHTMEPHG